MLRRQLLVWLLLPLLLLLAVDTFISYWVSLRFSQTAHDRALVEIARDISLHLKPEGAGLTLDLSADARDILLGDLTDRIFFEVIGPAGQPLAGEPIEGPPGGESGQEVFYNGTVRELGVRIVQIAVDSDSPTARPAAVVRVAETEVKRKRLAREILLSVVVPQALLIVVALIVVWIGVLRGLAPLERLRAALAARSKTDWSLIVADDVPGEVRPLLSATNNLLSRLDDALTLQHRFIADAAHQLKTPIAVLKTQLELALREEDPARMRESLAAAQAGHDRISRVVSQLLSLARNEPEASRAAVLAPLDLEALVFEVAAMWVPEALKRGIDLGFEGEGHAVMIKGDAARLRELLDNLVDNAVRYSPEGGTVTLRVEDTPTPTLFVSDGGPSIPAEDRRRIFERFHRVLGSAAGGSGLGLAIALEIARFHGATLDLLDRPNVPGNTFSVSFPSAH
ncbi:MAG: sensor histidine kinase N-terminal domain-containing protein [Usitatibacter sp.]